MPGDLTLGGFNKSWISGENEFRTFQISNVTGCPLRVKVKDITVGGLGHKKTSLFDSKSKPYYACINPFQSRFSLTRRMVSRLMNLTGHEPVVDGPDSIYYEGDKALKSLELTIKLKNLTSTIPPYELWSLKRGVASGTTGTYSILSNTTYEIAVKPNFDSSAGKETEILLGTIFLSTTYLVVDLDRGIFKLAPIKPTTSSARELRRICPVTHNPGCYDCGGDWIAGYVLFGIFLATDAMLFLWLYLRRYQKERRTRQDANPGTVYFQKQGSHTSSATPSASSEPGDIEEKETGLGDTEKKADIRVNTEGFETFWWMWFYWRQPLEPRNGSEA